MSLPKCINCEKVIEPMQLIEKYDVHFCSHECLATYEIKLKELAKVVDWDNCC